MFDRQEKLFAAGADQSDLFGPGDEAEAAKPAEGARHPLDLPQDFPSITSFEVRDAFQQLVERDLLGPYDGDFEELPPRSVGPRERYLVGMLGPKPSPKRVAEDADELPDIEIGAEGDGAEGELPDVLTPQNLGRLWASSMGMSFAVPADLDALAVTSRWGQYVKVETQIEGANGKPRTERIWGRRPVEHRMTIRLDEPTQKIPLTVERAEEPGVLLAVAVRPRPDHRRVVELTLVNQQIEPDTSADTAWLFQAELAAAAPPDGPADVFLPIDDPLDAAGRTTVRRIWRTSTCGCSTGTSAGMPSAATSPCTRPCLPARGGRRSCAPPGCRTTTCPRRSPRWGRARRSRAPESGR